MIFRRFDDWDAAFPSPKTEADYATLRILGRTTVSKSFPQKYGRRSDHGASTRTVWQVISERDKITHINDGEEEVVLLHESEAGRIQIKARVVRVMGRVAELRFERVTGQSNVDAKLTNLVTLDEEAASRLINLCQAFAAIDPDGSETQKIDQDLLAAVLARPEAVQQVYDHDPERFRQLIAGDKASTDVIAIASRRLALERFQVLLDDPEEFERARGTGQRERVWQKFFEANPWVLGIGLSGHLFTAYDEEKLEKAVAGSSVAGNGKRVDALLATSGAARSIAFAEFKLHDDPLVHKEFRPGCWSPTEQLTSGIAQAQTTIARARDDIGSWLRPKDDDGYSTGEALFAGAPRSFLIIGRLDSLMRGDQVNPDQVRSFELFRGHLHTPEVLTYDEVLARARWTLQLVEQDFKQDATSEDVAS